ncbi:MAG: EAL domain-containing protein [Campylobacterales bacterium]|nr:EAL domain-containing protein [Campylobacterales bacterium]
MLFQQQKNSKEILQNQATEINNTIQRMYNEQAMGIIMALQPIIADKRVKKALQAHDSETLLNDWKDVFQKMKQKAQLTHFYFLDANRTCLLRVHAPSKYGDTVNRFTALDAEWKKDISWGVELGAMGMFTLRVISPVYEGKTLLGYVELSKEIEDIFKSILTNSKVDLAVIINKQYLTRPSFEEGMHLLGRETEWDKFSQDVLIFSSYGALPKNIDQIIKEHHLHHDTYKQALEIASHSNRTLNLSISPMNDVSGKEIGDLIIINDISASKNEFISFLIFYTLMGTALAVIILSFIFWLLHKTKKTVLLQEENIEKNNKRFNQLTIQSSVMVWEVDTNGLYTYVSEASQTILGYLPEELIEKKHFYDLHPEDGKISFKKTAFKFFDAHESFKDLENQVLTRENKTIWLATNAFPILDNENKLLGYCGSDRDITEQKRSQITINTLALYDQLTSLPNKTSFLEKLQQAIAKSVLSQNYGTLFFIDLDNFKILNDTMGHEKGDMLLQQAANRITQCLSKGNTVARFSGDEFSVILSEIGANEDDATKASEIIAQKILSELSRVYFLGEETHKSSASIGITLFNANSTIDTLMQEADIAMYSAKKQGRNRLCFFDLKMHTTLKERTQLEDDLKQGVQENQFVLYYQAQVEKDGYITGVEALVRWNHPLNGMVSPAEFIPIAEESGVILGLGKWILTTACHQLVLWSKIPQTETFEIAVNVSARQFAQDDFVSSTLLILEKTGANPHRLKLELTESLLINNIEDVIEKMTLLKAVGVTFSLDDFGTGYSSLSYLKRLPLAQLKIDQSFVRDILNDVNDAIICKSTIALADSLGLNVIAEGVETVEQQDALRQSGCKNYQGYLFSRPLPIEDFNLYLKKQNDSVQGTKNEK